MLTPQYLLPIHEEITVDLFAGGGGMSTAIERAVGRPPDIAINHDENALSMHAANHPQTRHLHADVREVCPRVATQGRPVGLLHLSPDCTEHSQAKGGQPRDRKIRALAWVGVHWSGTVRPRIITLENVRQITRYGPLIAKRCPATGRVVRLDGTVAAPGERTPLREQYLIPDPKRAGRTWRRLLATFRAHGYVVDHRILRADQHGDATSRERLFMIARRDGVPITWPAPTHAAKPVHGQKRARIAADCIDWSIPCRSIFDRDKPLAEATLRRLAHGVMRFVIEAQEPFIVPVELPGDSGAQLAAATLIQAGYGERPGQAPRVSGLHKPLGTIVAGGGKHALVTAFLAQHNNHRGAAPNAGRDLRRPMPTIVGAGTQGLVTAHLLHLRNNCSARSAAEPLRVVSAGGGHHGLVQCRLEQGAEDAALRVAAFLMRYYGQGGQLSSLHDPMPTATTKDRLALVTVTLAGADFVVTDILMRMLQPPELYAAHSFPAGYQIQRGHDGRRFTRAQQVHMVGNSVPVGMGAALIRSVWRPFEQARAA